MGFFLHISLSFTCVGGLFICMIVYHVHALPAEDQVMILWLCMCIKVSYYLLIPREISNPVNWSCHMDAGNQNRILWKSNQYWAISPALMILIGLYLSSGCLKSKSKGNTCLYLTIFYCFCIYVHIYMYLYVFYIRILCV